MKISEVIERRISVRAFKPDPVPGSVVRDILRAASRSPSGGNLQPWRVYALSGEPLEAFKAIIAAKLVAGESETPEYDVYPHNLWEPFKKRRRDTGAQRYAALGVNDKDKAALKELGERNYRFFGAPVGLFFCLDRRLGPPQWSDMGMYMLSVMLLAAERGLAGQHSGFSGPARRIDAVRRHVDGLSRSRRSAQRHPHRARAV